MTTRDEQIQAFAEALVDEAWQKQPATGICRPFLKEKAAALLEFPPADLIAGLAKQLDRRDVQSILLAAPELWIQLGIVDWFGIMQRLSPRPQRTFADWSGRYADIEFMSLYLRVNAMEIALSPQLGLDVADVVRICEFCRDEADLLFLGEDAAEDLNGELLCSIQELDIARTRMISEDESVAPPYTNPDSMREYANSLLNSIGQE